MSLFDIVFGCSHKRCSFPLTAKGALRRNAAASVTGTYIVCLDCGKEFPYDWKQMKVVHSMPRESQVPETVVALRESKVA